MEKLAQVALFGGVGCFALAGVVTGWLPIAHLSRIKYEKVETLVAEPSEEWKDLGRRYPDAMKKYYGEASASSFREALKLGRDVYIAEACWHCHSQFVRPVSNEDIRFGKVSYASEY